MGVHKNFWPGILLSIADSPNTWDYVGLGHSTRPPSEALFPPYLFFNLQLGLGLSINMGSLGGNFSHHSKG
jgi:hypothetical protein